MSKQTGIRERILSAKSPEEIKQLLDEVRGYDFVSARTLSACASAARRRLKVLVDAKVETK